MFRWDQCFSPVFFYFVGFLVKKIIWSKKNLGVFGEKKIWSKKIFLVKKFFGGFCWKKILVKKNFFGQKFYLVVRARTRAHAHARARTRAHARACTHARAHTCTHVYTHKLHFKMSSKYKNLSSYHLGNMEFLLSPKNCQLNSRPWGLREF